MCLLVYQRIKPNNLCNQSGSSGGFIFPGSRELLGKAVVSGQSVNSALDENESKLGVLVLSVTVKVLADGHCLLDKHVEILRNFRSKS